MKIIGLTGGIGSGKSTVLEFLQGYGMDVYVADVEAKKLMNTDRELIDQVLNLFGNQSYKDGKLNRSYISSIVFNDKDKLEALNKLVHPKVHAHFKDFIAKSTAEFVVYEAAILFESGSDKFCDYIILVTANIEDRIERVMRRDGVSKKQVLERIKHQLKDDYKIKKADFVIENVDLEQTELQVAALYDLICDLK